MTPEDTCRLHFGAQAGCPNTGSSPVLVLLHVLLAVLKSFDVEQGPWPLLLGAEPLLWSLFLQPLKGPDFIYLCDLKWPRASGAGSGPRAGVGFPLRWHPLIQRLRTTSSHPQFSAPLPPRLPLSRLQGGGHSLGSPVALGPEQGAGVLPGRHPCPLWAA